MHNPTIGRRMLRPDPGPKIVYVYAHFSYCMHLLSSCLSPRQKSGANRAEFGHFSMWPVGAAPGPRLYSYQYSRSPGLRKESSANAESPEDHAIPGYRLPTAVTDRHQQIPDQLFWANVLAAQSSIERSCATPLNMCLLKGQNHRKERGPAKVEEIPKSA